MKKRFPERHTEDAFKAVVLERRQPVQFKDDLVSALAGLCRQQCPVLSSLPSPFCEKFPG